MIKVIKIRIWIYLTIVATCILMSSKSAAISAFDSNVTKIRHSGDSLFALVSDLDRQSPLSKDKLEAVLKADAWNERDVGSVRVFELASITPASDIEIDEVEFRSYRNGRGSITILRLSIACISRPDLARKYAGIRITHHPHGHSLEEETLFSIDRKWGTLSFGFKERNRDCLSSVILDTED